MPSSDFKAHMAGLQAQRQVLRAQVEGALAVTPGIILTPKTGRPRLVIVTRDTYPGSKGWRVATFMADGPWGHTTHATMHEAIDEVVRDASGGTVSSASDADVMEWTSTPEFVLGSKRVAFAQAANALRFHAKGQAAYKKAYEVEQAAHGLFDADPDAAVALLEQALREQGDTTANPSRPLRENPDWVTHAIAQSYDILEDKVPPPWLPKLEDVRPGPRGSMMADMREYGCGGYGCVLPTLDEKVVLKATTDETEAEFAAKFSDHLAAPVCVRYYMAVSLPARHDKRKIYLLWRQAADHVGEVRKMLGIAAQAIINRQYELAADVYLHIYRGATDREVLAQMTPYVRFLEQVITTSATPAPIAELFRGLLTVLAQQRIFFGDIHDGNLGLVDRRWVIVDPGNVAVLPMNIVDALPVAG